MVNISNYVPGLNATSIVSLTPIQSIISLLFKIVGGLAGLYIIYLIVSFIADRVKNKRIKSTHKNTNKILDKLEDIEDKLDKVLGKRKERAEKKPEHKEKKKK